MKKGITKIKTKTEFDLNFLFYFSIFSFFTFTCLLFLLIGMTYNNITLTNIFLATVGVILIFSTIGTVFFPVLKLSNNEVTKKQKGDMK